MDNLNLQFFEAYKELDEMCKQVLSSNRGVSAYIDEMEKEGHVYVENWEKDYRQLKKMRWIRNRLAHETNVFEEDIITAQDIEWLKLFRTRIMELADPFSLLHQQKCSNTKKYVETDMIYIDGKEIQMPYIENSNQVNDSEDNMKDILWVVGVGLFVGILVSAIIMCICVFRF